MDPTSPARAVHLLKRTLRSALAGTVLALIGLVGQAAAGPSGLPWPSGVSCSGTDFAGWRGRPLDIAVGWAPYGTWQAMVGYFAKDQPKRLASKAGGNASIAVGLLAKEAQGRFADCALGAYDQHFRAIGQHLARQSLSGADIRLGWEANGTWYPWSIGGQIEPYKACFRRAVEALRSGAPGLKITWHMAKKGKLSGPVTSAYPGDAHVDHVGLSYYDSYPAHTTEAVWNSQLNATKNGGPYGLGAWLAFAKSRGKKLAIGEWAIDTEQRGSGDNPLYVTKMHGFFRENAAHIAYEAYFNCKRNSGAHLVYPASYNPRASAAYLQLWQ